MTDKKPVKKRKKAPVKKAPVSKAPRLMSDVGVPHLIKWNLYEHSASKESITCKAVVVDGAGVLMKCCTDYNPQVVSSTRRILVSQMYNWVHIAEVADPYNPNIESTE